MKTIIGILAMILFCGFLPAQNYINTNETLTEKNNSGKSVETSDELLNAEITENNVEQILEKSVDIEAADIKKAIREKIASEFAGTKYAYFSNAWLYASDGQNYLAIDYYTKAIDKGLDKWYAYSNRGMEYAETENFDLFI